MAESLEYHFLLGFLNANAGIADREGNTVASTLHRQDNLAARGKFERIGEEISEDLLEPGVVRLDYRKIVIDLGPQIDTPLGRLRRKAAHQLIGDVAAVHLLQRKVQLTGLHLGQIEDVVDEGEKVFAGALDRVRPTNLLGGKCIAAVVGQQTRHDQEGVERRAQLVTHVRDEFGFVTALGLQSLCLLRKDALRAGEFIALCFQLLGLTLELRVLLLEFRLLLLETPLTLLERAGLLLEFLVGGCKLLTMSTQLLRLALRFLQQLSYPHAIASGADSDTDAFLDTLEQGQGVLVCGSVEAKLQYTVEIPVGMDWNDDGLGDAATGQAGAVSQRLIRQRIERQNAFLANAPPQMAVALSERSWRTRVGRYAIVGGAAEVLAIADVENSGASIQALRQYPQNAIGHNGKLDLALRRAGDGNLSLLQPIGPLEADPAADEEISGSTKHRHDRDAHRPVRGGDQGIDHRGRTHVDQEPHDNRDRRCDRCDDGNIRIQRDITQDDRDEVQYPDRRPERHRKVDRKHHRYCNANRRDQPSPEVLLHVSLSLVWKISM